MKILLTAETTITEVTDLEDPTGGAMVKEGLTDEAEEMVVKDTEESIEEDTAKNMTQILPQSLPFTLLPNILLLPDMDTVPNHHLLPDLDIVLQDLDIVLQDLGIVRVPSHLLQDLDIVPILIVVPVLIKENPINTGKKVPRKLETPNTTMHTPPRKPRKLETPNTIKYPPPRKLETLNTTLFLLPVNIHNID